MAERAGDTIDTVRLQERGKPKGVVERVAPRALLPWRPGNARGATRSTTRLECTVFSQRDWVNRINHTRCTEPRTCARFPPGNDGLSAPQKHIRADRRDATTGPMLRRVA